MPFLDAHAGTVLVVFAIFAIALGLAAHVLAIRLLLRGGQPANDEVFRRACRTRARTVKQVVRGRGHLYLVS